MNAATAAKAILYKQLTLDSVAQLRSVIVKLALLTYPMLIFLTFMLVRTPGNLFYTDSVWLVVSIAVLGAIYNLDFRPHKFVATLAQICKWGLVLALLLQFRSVLAKDGGAILNWLSHYGLDSLPNVRPRVWLLILLMVLYVPAGIRLFTLRDVRAIFSLIPFVGARHKLQAASITFFLLCNTFGRRMRAAWQIASEKHFAVDVQNGRKPGLITFTRDFVIAISHQALDLVLLTAQLVSQRGFREDIVISDKWGWRAYSAEDVVAGCLIIILAVGWLRH